MQSQQSLPAHLLAFIPHLLTAAAILQENSREELGLRNFQQSKMDHRKVPAIATLSASEEQALIEASVASDAADTRRLQHKISCGMPPFSPAQCS